MRTLGWFIAGFATAMAVKDRLPDIVEKIKGTVNKMKEEAQKTQEIQEEDDIRPQC